MAFKYAKATLGTQAKISRERFYPLLPSFVQKRLLSSVFEDEYLPLAEQRKDLKIIEKEKTLENIKKIRKNSETKNILKIKLKNIQ